MSYTRGGGDGLEWHADGEKGEVTVIMTMEDLALDQGGLGILLSSHVKLKRGEAFHANEGEEHGVQKKAKIVGEQQQQVEKEEEIQKVEEEEENGEKEDIDFDEQITQFAKFHKDNHNVNKTYYYKAWQPILFDARLLHCAYKSVSSKRRVILWWIYNIEN